MYWRLLVEAGWDKDLAAIAYSPIPKRLEGQERIAFYKAREAAQRSLIAFFPPDEEPNGES